MTDTNKSTEYNAVAGACVEAIRADAATGNKWEKAGASVRAFFGVESALTEVKAQFIADAILPALDKRHATALAKELPRKGSEGYNALDQAGRDKWEAANQAKKDARATCHTYFTRIVRYAFPTEKAEAAPRSLKTRLAEELAGLIKACEKAEAPDFDVAATLTGLRAALAACSK